MVAYTSEKFTSRNQKWIEDFQSGSTIQQIEDHSGVSRQRVHQVLRSLGVDIRAEGVALRSLNRRSEFMAERQKLWEDREGKRGLPTGVYLHKSSKLFFAQVGRRRVPGYFKDWKDAAVARAEAMNETLSR